MFPNSVQLKFSKVVCWDCCCDCCSLIFVLHSSLCLVTCVPCCFTVAKGDTCSLQLLCSSRGTHGQWTLYTDDMLLSLCRLGSLEVWGTAAD